MRFDISVIRRDGYKFVVEYDLGGPPGGDYMCWVYYDGKPLLEENGSGHQVRKYFGTSFNEVHFKNFVNKFVTDENYRKKYLSGEIHSKK